MKLSDFCRAMPKVELHVHLEGSVRPETILKLADKNSVSLPAEDVQGLKEWYAFTDFPHFVQIYVAISKCIQSAEDLEFVIREFVDSQVEQNILHSEVTFSASTFEKHIGIPWEDQERALLNGIAYAAEQGINIGFILDIVRGDTPENALRVANWAIKSDAVIALGLAGEESRGTTQYMASFDLAREHGFPIVPHAGETMGPESVWETIECTKPLRIGHGVRSIEDPKLIDKLRDSGIPLEVCPSSNVALGVYKSLDDHPLPLLLDSGLVATINSDDPPMFGTSLSEEFIRCADAFEFNEDILWSLCLNAAKSAILEESKKKKLIALMRSRFTALMDSD